MIAKIRGKVAPALHKSRHSFHFSAKKSVIIRKVASAVGACFITFRLAGKQTITLTPRNGLQAEAERDKSRPYDVPTNDGRLAEVRQTSRHNGC